MLPALSGAVGPLDRVARALVVQSIAVAEGNGVQFVDAALYRRAVPQSTAATVCLVRKGRGSGRCAVARIRSAVAAVAAEGREGGGGRLGGGGGRDGSALAARAAVRQRRRIGGANVRYIEERCSSGTHFLSVCMVPLVVGWYM